jgi:hypothetical protein
MKPTAVSAVLAACFLVTACSSVGQTMYGQSYEFLKLVWGQSSGNGNITLSEAAKIPYASIGYRLNGDREQLLILATDFGSEQLWTSGSHVVIMTQNGRAKRTVGLPHDLGGVTPAGAAALPAPVQALGGPVTVKMIVDYSASPATPVTCNMVMAKRETIKILGRAIATTRIDEFCTAMGRDWRYRNRYWVDSKDGFVWRALQYLGPKDILQIEIFRPPA